MARRRSSSVATALPQGIEAWLTWVGETLGRAAAGQLHRAEEKPAAPAKARAARAASKPASAATASSAATARIRSGGIVRYRQGRGEFDAKVISIDAKR